MRKKLVNASVLCVWLFSALSVYTTPVVAYTTTGGQTIPAPGLQTAANDQDFDGLSDAIESGGWRNNAGGPYQTDPTDPDSDDDGLPDGQEQLYDTNPLDDTSPGIYVEYSDDLKTSKYFSWQRHGNNHIATDTVIVRRGSTFYIGGPADASIEIGKSLSWLTSLWPTKHQCGPGRWQVEVPIWGTVGKYTITMEKDGWSKSIDLYVIFDLPTNMSQDEIETYVYSDDPANTRDEYSIFYVTADIDWYYGSAYHQSVGYGYRFQTDQYQSYVVEHAMNAVNGYSDRESAAIALGQKTDSMLYFEDEAIRFNMWDSINWSGKWAQCSTHANVSTGFARAAGIPARPAGVDWDNFVAPTDLFDYSTEIWVGYDWKVMRAYRAYEVVNNLPVQSGIVYPRNRRYWLYPQSAGDMIVSAEPGWDFADMNTYWDEPQVRDFIVPNYNKYEIMKWDWVKTLAGPYWGWWQEPTDEGDPDSDWFSWPYSAGSSQQPAGPASEAVQLGGVAADYGLDQDGDGRFDELVIEVEVNVTQPGHYTLGGVIDSDEFVNYSRLRGMASAMNNVYLEAGNQTVRLSFRGRTISDAKANGPYDLAYLWITDLPADADATQLRLRSNWLDVKESAYTTQAYQASDFESAGAALSGVYTHQAYDTDKDGYLDTLVVNTGLDIVEPDTYRVEGVLVDGSGREIATASWSGSGDQVSLQFNARLGDVTAYHLRNVRLYKGQEGLIDSANGNDLLGAGVYSTGPLYNLGLAALESAQSVTPTVTSAQATDADGDGDFDSLDFVVNTAIAVEGDYRL
ncbi:MAG: hypothetical protein ACE5H9_04865, partial [Anaerolineae bacterium]